MEHSLLIALLALGLLLVLARFADTVGGVTRRSATTVSTRVSGGYGGTAGIGGDPSAKADEDKPSAPDPDSTAAEPDSSLAGESDSAASRGLLSY